MDEDFIGCAGVLILFVAIVAAGFATWDQAVKHTREQAAKAGAGHYTVDPETGTRWWVWDPPGNGAE